MPDENDSLGRCVANARKRKKFSQDELSKVLAHIGVSLSAQAINNIEHSRRDAREDSSWLKALAQTLDISLEQLNKLAQRFEIDSQTARDSQTLSTGRMIAFRRSREE